MTIKIDVEKLSKASEAHAAFISGLKGAEAPEQDVVAYGRVHDEIVKATYAIVQVTIDVVSSDQGEYDQAFKVLNDLVTASVASPVSPNLLFSIQKQLSDSIKAHMAARNALAEAFQLATSQWLDAATQFFWTPRENLRSDQLDAALSVLTGLVTGPAGNAAPFASKRIFSAALTMARDLKVARRWEKHFENGLSLLIHFELMLMAAEGLGANQSTDPDKRLTVASERVMQKLTKSF